MTGICPKCHYSGRGEKNRLFDKWGANTNLTFGLGVLTYYLYSISYGSMQDEGPLFTLIDSIISLSIAIGLIAASFLESKTCPKCDHDPMLSFEEAEALKNLKEKDLKSSKDTSEESSPQST